MILVCSSCGATNRIPDTKDKGNVYRCWRCKTNIMHRAEEVNQKQVISTSSTMHHEVTTTGILAFGILLLCFAIGLLVFSTITTAADKISLYEKESLDIVMYSNIMLSEIAEPIENIGQEEIQLALLMENTIQRVEGQGLSAPQVGVSKRMSVIRLNRPASSTEVIVIINPYIIEQEGSSTALEGCLSLPRDLKVEVTRSERILLKFLTLEGKETILEERGTNARVIQHEIDHLNGILIVDYAKGFEITTPILVAIIVYSMTAFIAVTIYMHNRMKRRVAD